MAIDINGISCPNGTTVTKIASEITKAMFIRKAWEQIAKEDPPRVAFNSNFSEVTIVEHEILIEKVTAEVTYQASIGYDRKETYTVYKDVTKYNGNVSYKVKEPVTETRTVTVWSPFNSVMQCSSVAIEENIPGFALDKQRFAECYDSKRNDSVSGLGDNTQHSPSAAVIDQCNRHHIEEYLRQIKGKLPGDRYRDLRTTSVRITSRTRNLVLCPEYSSTLIVTGKSYTKKTFPFGTATIGGDIIDNTEGIRAFSNQSTSEAQGVVKDHVKYIWIGPLVLLVLSFILGAVNGGLAAVCIIGSIALLIVQLVRHSNLNKTENQKSDERVSKYSTSYNQSMQELLNQKMQQIGAYGQRYAEDDKISASQTQRAETTQSAAAPKGEEPVKIKYCVMCGNQVRSTARFCPVCGAKRNV